MKPCTLEYQGVNGTPTSTHYVLSVDVIKHHGEQFFEAWKNIVKNFEGLSVSANCRGTYYVDYAAAAYAVLTEHV